MLRITSNTKVILYNMIANEMSLETDTNYDVISYVNFMKSLLEISADVKMLRKEGILSSRLGNEEILQMFKEINTGGADNWGLFQDVRMRIEEHCHSKVKTAMADLYQTYFSNPWSAIALIIAGFGFCLTLLRAVDELKKL
ncbi:hypothetical protein Salat_0964500 [Sesamum alatum]|uniref:Uncharacterized protein n=1 Tax=Sesamum alatum TaxID=300844 RepID=A0AAE1YL41_9LAMI|nr:hypothetical protein Salat_0964500 [Sesamum alatum]